MKTRAAVLWEYGDDWKIEEVDLDPPKAGEVLVQMKAAGLCHSDEHVRTRRRGLGVPVGRRLQHGLFRPRCVDLVRRAGNHRRHGLHHAQGHTPL